MAQEILIIGESGSGKSTSLENLDPKSTFIINVGQKPMPFRGWKSNYTKLTKENPQGNYIESDNAGTIVQTMKHINENMPHIKTVVVDDFQYVMANEYMRRANERGFDKFTEIGLHAWEVAQTGKNMREDITFVMIGHAEQSTDLSGNRRLKFKTVGKLVDNVITMEGMFTVVLFTDVSVNADGQRVYNFITQSDGTTTAKSPRDMFEFKIPNDIKTAIESINQYYN
jgi:predicted ATP-dependent serine protease